MNFCFEARFVNLSLIELSIDNEHSSLINEELKVFCDKEEIERSNIEVTKSNEKSTNFIIHIQSFKFGGLYEIKINDEFYNVNVLEIMNEKIIDDNYYYDGNDLGFKYTKKETTFKLWSPLASKAFLYLTRKKKTEELPMFRGEHGVFVCTIKGNLDGCTYLYGTMINGRVHKSIDPYAKASTANGMASAVINLENTDVKKDHNSLPKFEKYTDAIIYESSIRDLTSFADTNVQHKGKYLGAVEANKISSNGARVGLNHLVKMGITHIQLLPVEDFATCDELHPDRKYNWGYDPMQYNVPEGSYSTDADNPYSRIKEFKHMVQEFHKNGIRVNMDVVYNHMYDYKKSGFEVLTPNYFFRHRKDGVMSNGSFCGNDLASERKMVHKFIVDSCRYWVKEYDVDGFRFDLMGLLDIDTIRDVYNECLAIKKGLMFYGEGWNMQTFLNQDQKACMENFAKMPQIGFFNDAYRDIAKGKSYDNLSANKGYLLENEEYIEGFKYIFMGSVVDYCFKPKFLSANQSVNYVECHDNETLFDKIDATFKGDSINQKLKRVSLINQTVVLSFGIPFIHMGQEIGLSKFGETNTYNKGDKYNQFDYSKMEERKWMVKSMNHIIKIRKMFPFLAEYDPEKIKDMVNFEHIDNSGLIIQYNKKYIGPYLDFKVFINPSLKTTYYDLGDYYQVLYNEAGILNDEMFSQSVMINPLTMVIVVKK